MQSGFSHLAPWFPGAAAFTGHKVGAILNFRRAKLEWERIVLERNR